MKNTSNIEKIAVVGVVLTAITSPCCFPLFGIVLPAIGFGSFELFGGITMYVFLAFVVLSLVGAIFSFLYNKKRLSLFISLVSVFLIFYNYLYDAESYNMIYIGMIGLMISSIINYYETKLFSLMKNKAIKLNSVITCPSCGHQREEIMPTDSCQFFYECENCKIRLKPKTGDCCVYCSYGSVPCPPIQETGKTCC